MEAIFEILYEFILEVGMAGFLFILALALLTLLIFAFIKPPKDTD